MGSLQQHFGFNLQPPKATRGISFRKGYFLASVTASAARVDVGFARDALKMPVHKNGAKQRTACGTRRAIRKKIEAEVAVQTAVGGYFEIFCAVGAPNLAHIEEIATFGLKKQDCPGYF